MAMSIDALLAIVLFLAMIAFLSLEPVSEMPTTQPRIALNQLVDDAVAAMDSTGFIMQSIESGDAGPIETRLQGLLAENIGFRLEMLQYESTLDEPGSQCRTNKDFETCFPNLPTEFFTVGEEIPADKEVFHGRKIFIKKEPGDCILEEGIFQKKAKELVAFFQGNHAPEARDVNITSTGCPSERSPCPVAGDTMSCCYAFYDEDSDLEVFPPEFKWYKYDGEATEGDKWILQTGQKAQTVVLGGLDDGNMWKCSVKVKDDSGETATEWSQDSNSPFAIVDGPCFVFDSSLSPEPMQCGVSSNASFTLSAEVGGRKSPVDIMLLMDRSGSMSWLDYYSGASGTERSVFTDSDSNTAYLGTSSYVYKIDVNTENGELIYSGSRTGIEDARSLYVDDDYVFVADDYAGLTALDKDSMGIIKTIGDITTAEGITGQGDNVYIAATGMTTITRIIDESAKVTGLPEEQEQDKNSLDCTGGYMSIGNVDWGSQAGTISFWVKRDSKSDNDRFWGQHNDMEIRYRFGDLTLDWGVSSGSSSETIRVDDPLDETGKWYFVAVAWNEATNDLYLYVGDEDSPPTEVAHNNDWTYTVSDEGIAFGNWFMRSGSGYGEAVDGKGEELRYYNTDRSLAEIQSDYKQELAGNETDLVSYFKLDGDFTDFGPAGSPASASGSTSWSDDTPLGLAVEIEEHSLDCTGGYMIVGNGNVDWGSNRGTISFWVKFDNVGERMWGQHNYMETRFSWSSLVLDWGGSSSLTTSNPFEAGKWYFVAIVWDEVSDDLYLYVGDEDNEPSQIAYNSNWTSRVSTQGVEQNRFMRSGSGYDSSVDGKGDELRYYNVDRSLAEIQRDYRQELTGNEPDLVSYFKLNEDFTDAGPAGDNGSAVGSTRWSEDTPMPLLEGEAHIGKDSSESWAAQSFKPSIILITEASLPLTKIGSPSGDITVHVRSTIDGSDLTNGTVTISGSDIPQNLGWVSVDFPGQGVSVNTGSTYFIALTTTGLDSGNYFIWGSVTSTEDIYSDGTLWECTSSDECTERQPPNQVEYEDAGFQIYYEGPSPAGLVIIDKGSPSPSNWHVEGSLHDTGSGVIQGNDIAVSGNYAYVTDASSPAFEGFLSINDAISVAVSGDYAYVVEEDTGLHVVNVQDKSSPVISKTLSDLAEVQDVHVDGTTAYVTANNTGIGATENGLHLIDISEPENASLIETFYFPYGSLGRLYVGEKFAYLINSQYGLVTMHKLFGPKINISRDAAKEFVLFEDWNAPEDQIGVASYGGISATLNSQLLAASSENKETINSQIDLIMANGGTPMYLGLRKALDELEDNGREDAVQFIIMLADGQSSQNFDTFVKPEVSPRARNNEVYIFTIGFGGDVDESQMLWITENAYCPDGLGGQDCGTYHHIADPEALSEVYEIISQDIAALVGLMPDGDKTNISMQFTQFAGGISLTNFDPDPGPGNWDGTTLRYLGIDITDPWTASFDVTIACHYTGCGDDFVAGASALFPPENTVIEFTVEDVNQDSVYWPKKFSSGGEFYYNDLALEFISGQFHSAEKSSLEYQVLNKGYIADDLGLIRPTISFYSGDDALQACDDMDPTVGEENSDGVLDAAYGINQGPNQSIDISSSVGESGWLCIWLNHDQDIVECEENNKQVVNCAIPETFVYALDYWAWEK